MCERERNTERQRKEKEVWKKGRRKERVRRTEGERKEGRKKTLILIP